MLMERPTYRKTLVKSDAMTSDIIQAIHSNFAKAVQQTRMIATHLRGRNARESAKNVWDYLKTEIVYTRDPDHSQMIRMPARFLADRKGDCKSYSLFAAAVLHNMGYPVWFRYASYSYGSPSHVYVITRDEIGERIIVDGVYNQFNQEKSFTNSKDYKMDVYSLSGIGAKKKRKKKGGFFKKLGKGLKKIGLAPARRAFRTVVAVNFHGMASKLKRAVQRDSGAVQRKWEKLGGKYSELLKSINIGAKKKRILGVGIAPAAAAPSWLVIAAPVMIAMIPLIKGLIGNGAGDDAGSTGETTLDKIESVTRQAVQAAGGDSSYASDPTSPGNADNFDTEAGKDDSPGFTLSPVMWIGIGLGAYFLLKKSK